MNCAFKFSIINFNFINKATYCSTLNSKAPAALTLFKLRKGFPEDWTEQRKMFGME